MKSGQPRRQPRGLRVLSLAGGMLALTRPACSATVSILHTFASTDGATPKAGLVADAAGSLYGTTYVGGTNGRGTIFRLDAGTRAFTSLYSFPSTLTGANPNALSFDLDGNLVGTTFAGASNGAGTVFRFTPSTKAVATLATFKNGGGPKYPVGALVTDTDGDLYGASQNGGLYDDGAIFKVAAGTNVVTVSVSFQETDGENPEAGLYRDASGNVFGTTEFGGANHNGTAFELAAGSTTVTTIATFTSPGNPHPKAALIADASGNLYGTTDAGGHPQGGGYGTVFKIAAGTHVLTQLASFDLNPAASPEAALLLDAAGNLYGTTLTGSVFKVAAGTNALTTLATPGGQITSSLVADAAGNLYGTTTTGGAGGYGTVFELTNTGFIVPEPTSLSTAAVAACLFRRRRRC